MCNVYPIVIYSYVGIFYRFRDITFLYTASAFNAFNRGTVEFYHDLQAYMSENLNHAACDGQSDGRQAGFVIAKTCSALAVPCGTRKSGLNPIMPALKLHSNGLLHSNTVIGTLAVNGWAVTFCTARRGLGGLRPRPVPSSLYQM